MLRQSDFAQPTGYVDVSLQTCRSLNAGTDSVEKLSDTVARHKAGLEGLKILAMFPLGNVRFEPADLVAAD